MPKKIMDYSKTVIYKIVCNDLNIKDLYVGHTINFISRKSYHKSACNDIHNNDHNMKVYQFIRDNGGWNNWSMIEIEKYPCNDGNEARKRERHYVELLGAQLNRVIPSRSRKESSDKYYQDHREQLRIKSLEKYIYT